MLFRQVHVDKILDGTKTQTRRLWKRPHVVIGRVYPVQTKMFGKREEAKAWIRVTGVRQEMLAAISVEDALAEGGYTQSEFFQVFGKINPRNQTGRCGYGY